jgi:predicted amidohydrolase
MTRFLIAAAQVAPVFLDRDATIEKACMCTADAGSHGARLLVFPETFVPGYPCWTWLVPPRENRMLAELYAELVSESIDVPGPETEKLCAAARRAGVFVVIGVNERNADSSGSSLYNTILYIDERGTLLGKHRKLLPTAPERMVHSQGEEWVNVGDSAIVSPDGKIIAGPSNRKEEILYAEVDRAQMTGSRWKLDVAGHYGRPDVFNLAVNRRTSPFISEEKLLP